MPEIKFPSSFQLDKILENQQKLLNVLDDGRLIMGVHWDKTSLPTLTRTDASVGKVANVGVDGEIVTNDFDNMPIYREIGEYIDELGNVFIKIPKFYIQKVDGNGYKRVRISKTQYPGFYFTFGILGF